MEHPEFFNMMEQALDDSTTEFECPKCGAVITPGPDSQDLYCNECKMIVMQTTLPLKA